MTRIFKASCILLTLSLGNVMAQNTFPATGNVGIATTTHLAQC
jgi:hypothetical protein